MNAGQAGHSIRTLFGRLTKAILRPTDPLQNEAWSIMRSAPTVDAYASIESGSTSKPVGSVRELFLQEASDDLTQFGPVTQCVCGSNLFTTLLWLGDDGSVGGYFTDGRCASCGADVVLATEIDRSPFAS